MKKIRGIKAVICFGMLACNCQVLPAWADEATTGQTAQTQASERNAPATNSATKAPEKKPFSLGRLPAYVAGIATGAFVGMPISAVRRFAWEEKQGIQGLVGDSKNKVAIYSAGAFWLPFSALLGACEAPVMGPVNSLRYSDRPFSKDQFSLGLLGDGSSRDPG